MNGDNVISDVMDRKQFRMFNEGREDVQDEARRGCPSLANNDMVRIVNESVCDDRRFIIPALSLHFPQISRTLLYDTVRNHLGYQKLCAPCVRRMLTEEHKEMCSIF